MIVPPTDADDFVVSLLDGEGNVIRSAYLGARADQNTASEFEFANGKYTFKDVPMEADKAVQFSIRIEGNQQLDEGVYIYKGARGYDNDQTLIGYALGHKDVDVSASFAFRFDSEETKTVTTERYWKTTDVVERDPEICPETSDGAIVFMCFALVIAGAAVVAEIIHYKRREGF